MKIKNLLLLLLLACLWGPSFLFIKIALVELKPMTIACLRISIAAFALTLLIGIRGGKPIRSWTFWKHALLAGFFSQGLPFVAINWGEQYIGSALASILNGLTPIFTLVLAHFFISNDQMSIPKVLGIILSFIGLLIIISPHISENGHHSTLGIILVGTGAISYAVGWVYTKLRMMQVPPYYAPAGQLLATSFYLIPLSLSIDGPVPWATLSWSTIGAVLFLGIFGTAMAFVIYFRILNTAGPSYVSMVTYLLPLFGIVLGVSVLNESLSYEAITGAFFILLGLGITHTKSASLTKQNSSTEKKGKCQQCHSLPVEEKQPIVQVQIR